MADIIFIIYGSILDHQNMKRYHLCFSFWVFEWNQNNIFSFIELKHPAWCFSGHLFDIFVSTNLVKLFGFWFYLASQLHIIFLYPLIKLFHFMFKELLLMIFSFTIICSSEIILCSKSLSFNNSNTSTNNFISFYFQSSWLWFFRFIRLSIFFCYFLIIHLIRNVRVILWNRFSQYFYSFSIYQNSISYQNTIPIRPSNIKVRKW